MFIQVPTVYHVHIDIYTHINIYKLRYQHTCAYIQYARISVYVYMDIMMHSWNKFWRPITVSDPLGRSIRVWDTAEYRPLIS